MLPQPPEKKDPMKGIDLVPLAVGHMIGLGAIGSFTFTQRHVQVFGRTQHHRTAGLRLAGVQPAQMTG